MAQTPGFRSDYRFDYLFLLLLIPLYLSPYLSHCHPSLIFVGKEGIKLQWQTLQLIAMQISYDRKMFYVTDSWIQEQREV
jgi:hypothetical protein